MQRPNIRGRRFNQGAKKMKPFSSRVTPLEYKLIGDILKEYPQISEVMEKHFGGHCLEWQGFKIQSLGMACMLFGVDRKKLFKELEAFKN